MRRLFPRQVTLDADEQWRITRVHVCERLHITPQEFDAIPYPDLCDILEVWKADQEVDEIKGKR